MSKVQQIEVARYDLEVFSITVEKTDGKRWLVVYRKVEENQPLEADSARLTARPID